MLITFSGLDGAGKSTLIAWLQAHLQHNGIRVAVFHMNDHIGVYAYLRMLRDTIARVVHVRRPQTAAPRRGRRTAKKVQDAIIWHPVLRSALYPIDLLIFLCYRLWIEGIRGRVLVMDRYFYDTLVDLTAPRPRASARLLQRLTPTPALAVHLDISPEESFARKGEYSVAYLRRRHRAYHEVMPRVSSCLTVRNDDLTATQRALTCALTPRLRARAPGSADDLELAANILRALLDIDVPRTPTPDEWPAVTALAARNGVLLRLHLRYLRAGIALPPAFVAAVAAERERTHALFATIATVQGALLSAGVDVIFPRSFMHYPDAGSDIDLLVASRDVDMTVQMLTHALHAAPQPVRLRDRISGSATFRMPDCPALVDVHGGRIGPLGEQSAYARELLQSVSTRRTQRRTASECDQLVLQGMRVFGCRGLRLCDVIGTIQLLRSRDLDWQRVLSTARRTASAGALSCYLAYIEQIHQRAFGARVLPHEARAALPLAGWGSVSFTHGQFAIPVLRVNARLTLEKLAFMLRARSWRTAVGMCLLPFAAIAAELRRYRTGRARLALDTSHRYPE